MQDTSTESHRLSNNTNTAATCWGEKKKKNAHCHFCLNLHAEEEKGRSIVIYAKRPGTEVGLGMSGQPPNMGAAGGADEGNQLLFLPLKVGLLLLCREKLF